MSLFTDSLRQVKTAVILGLALASAFHGPSVAAYDIRTAAIVRVYSDGRLVASYEAIDQGYMEGCCYVFHIRRGLRAVAVRVCGTFTVEQVH